MDVSKFRALGSDVPEGGVKKTSDEEILYDFSSDPKRDEELSVHEQATKALTKETDRLTNLHEFRTSVAKFVFRLIFFWLLAVMLLVFLGSYEVYFWQGDCFPDQPLGFWESLNKTQTLKNGCSYLKQAQLPESKRIHCHSSNHYNYCERTRPFIHCG